MKKKKKGKIIQLKKRKGGFEIECVGCQLHFVTEDSSQRFCDELCEHFHEKNKEETEFSRTIDEVKLDYPKLTFRLSLIGFIGSIAFYLGVIRDLHHSPKSQKAYIEQLETQNQELKNEVDSINVILSK